MKWWIRLILFVFAVVADEVDDGVDAEDRYEGVDEHDHVHPEIIG